MRAGATFGESRDRQLGALPLPERDRRLAYELAAGVLRRQAELDRALELSTANPRLHDILRLGAYQLRALARVPAYAAVSTSVELAREELGERAARYVNHALRELAREPGSGKQETCETHPRWLKERWRRRFGADETARLVAWNDARPRLTVQPARWGPDSLRARLQEAGFGVADAPYGAGLQLGSEGKVSRLLFPGRLPGYREGAFIVQDPAHALVCRYAAIPRGALLYDACAAPGGKAVLLERAGARVVAGDARRHRIGRLIETVRRCGVAIRVVAADLLSAPFRETAADVVFVDAPCSATGTMARHPDARWRISVGAIARAAARQRQLLEAAAPLVAPAGLLVYATCSLEPEESTEVVEDFLSRHREFGREPVADAVPGVLLTAHGDFQSLPQLHGMDGAYAARLQRSA